MQGIAVAERAYQLAAAYAKERVQGRPVDGSLPGAGPIIHHPDVKRMLLTMRSVIEGCRAAAITAAAAHDIAHAHPDAELRKQSQAFYEFLVPLVKGFSTEMSVEVASLGVQVHGGMGFIEETGAAQHYRDARILAIYEGTTAIQANDLVGRKTLRDGGATAKALASRSKPPKPRCGHCDRRCRAGDGPAAGGGTAGLPGGRRLRRRARQDRPQCGLRRLGALPAAGRQPGGRLAARARPAGGAAEAGRRRRRAFMRNKIAVARFYAEHVLTRVPGLRDSVVDGAAAVNDVAVEAF